MHFFLCDPKSAVEAIWRWFFGRCVKTPPVMKLNIQIVKTHDAVECNGWGGVYCVAKATPISLQKMELSEFLSYIMAVDNGK